MAFERARNEENKRIRLEQIKEAALKLFDELPFFEITLSKIGKEINFTRANLYKYVSSKEDIYLFILLDEMEALVVEMEAALLKDEPLAPKELATQWARILNTHPRYMKLMSLLGTMIEQNAKMDTLVDFKNQLMILFLRKNDILAKNLPDFTEAEIYRLSDYISSLVMGRFAQCKPSEVQLEAMDKANFDFKVPDFESSFADVVLLLINGIKVSKLSL